MGWLGAFSRHALPLQGDGRRLAAVLPPGLAGHWCIVRLHGVEAPVRLSLIDQERGQVVREIFLAPGRRGGREVLVHLPLHARSVEFEAFPAPHEPGLSSPHAVIRRVPRAAAGLRLLLRLRRARASPRNHPSDAVQGRRPWRGQGAEPLALLGLPSLLRATIGRASLQLDAAPDYAAWIQLYDSAPARTRSVGDGLLVAVVEDASAPFLLERTLASLRAQGLSPAAALCCIADPPGWRAALDRAAGRPVAVLQAGECVAAGALAALLSAMQAGAALAYGDEDLLDAAGARTRPHFKPLIAPALLRSATLSSGLMAFRPELLQGIGDAVLVHADTLRLAATLHAFAAGPTPRIHRLQQILTHRSEGVAAPPWQVAQAVVSKDLAERGWLADIARGRVGLQVRLAPKETPTIGVVVPSACRSAHVLACLRRLIVGTEFPTERIIVAVSSSSLTMRQRRIMAALARLPRVQVLHYPLPAFDFAAVNNLAAQEIDADLLLLLNDDVAPLRPDWLGRMVAQLQDPAVGIVGARLLYGNGTVQHAGVVLGLAHLCEHNDKFARPGDPGPFGSVALDRDVSAVTGACLLIKTQLWRELGGFDPAFAIALNDVDLCLRARAAGHRVVYAASALLTHYESLSLGRHYSGARAHHESHEVRLLRQRWSAVIADDPFYNRNMSLEIGREWQPSFPPRQPAD